MASATGEPKLDQGDVVTAQVIEELEAAQRSLAEEEAEKQRLQTQNAEMQVEGTALQTERHRLQQGVVDLKARVSGQGAASSVGGNPVQQ